MGDAAAAPQQQGGNGSAGALPPAAAAAAQLQQQAIVRAPEDFVLPQGQLSTIDRERPQSPADVFRCAACTRPECATAAGCASMQWRHEPLGYIREVRRH